MTQSDRIQCDADQNPNSPFLLLWQKQKPNPQIYINCKGPQIAKIISEKENKVGGLIILNYKATAMKTMWHRHEGRDQWTRIESRTNLHVCGRLSADGGAKSVERDKR